MMPLCIILSTLFLQSTTYSHAVMSSRRLKCLPASYTGHAYRGVAAGDCSWLRRDKPLWRVHNPQNVAAVITNDGF